MAIELQPGDEHMPSGVKTLVKQASASGLWSRATYAEHDGKHYVCLKLLHKDSGLHIVADYQDRRFKKAYAWAPWLELREIGARDISKVLNGTLDPTPEHPVPAVFRDVAAAWAVERTKE